MHIFIYSKTDQLTEKRAALYKMHGHCEKSCEIKGGSQEMAVMV